MGVAGEGIDERESGKFEEGLNSKVKLSLFGKIVEFKKYLRPWPAPSCDVREHLLLIHMLANSSQHNGLPLQLAHL